MTFLALYVTSTPLFAQLLVRPLERSADKAGIDNADAIVILGGWFSESGGRIELGESSLARCVEGMRLFRAGVAKHLVVSGGTQSGSTKLGWAMQEFLVQEGMPESSITVEDQSTTTWQNASYSAEICRSNNWNKVVLVTDAAHQIRAKLCFQSHSIDVAAATVRALKRPVSWIDILPSPTGVSTTSSASHEVLGIVWYRLTGRFKPPT